MKYSYRIQEIACAFGVRARHLLQELKGAQIITLDSNRTWQNWCAGGNPRIYITQTVDGTVWHVAGVRLIARTLSSHGYDVPVEDPDILNLLQRVGR